MTDFSQIDDFYRETNRTTRKLMMKEILGLPQQKSVGHHRYYSDHFIPFVAQRNVKGQIIKEHQQIQVNSKKDSILKSPIKTDLNFKPNFINENKKNQLIEERFKFHQINHFKVTEPKSHLSRLLDFKREVQSLNNKEYEKKCRNQKTEENVWITNYNTTIQTEKGQGKNKFQVFKKNKNANSLKNLDHAKKKDELNWNDAKVLKLGLQNQTKSYKLLLTGKSQIKQELKQIERRAKIHFDHPQLERLKQSRKLTFKYLQNIEKGDNRFKTKVEEYKLIKEKIKKEMNKL